MREVVVVVVVVVVPPVLTAAPLARVSPARTEQTGQAPGPCTRSTFWAMRICCSRVARWAYDAYCVPPNPRQVV